MRGSVASINSQGRYAYAGADPVNNVDPSGASPVSGGAYERAMGRLGGINELYNFYVGRTLEDAQSQAAGAFSAQLARAYGTDYRSLSAISSIAQVSQQAADACIAKGAVAALAAGASWGCSPGALTGAAVLGFAATVSAAKDSVNAQIATVQANKRAQYGQYQAWLAYQAWLRQQQAYQAELERQAQAAPQGISQRTLGQLTRLEAMERKTAASPYMGYAPIPQVRGLATTTSLTGAPLSLLAWSSMASALSTKVFDIADKRMVSVRFAGYGLGKNAFLRGKRPTDEDVMLSVHLTLDMLGLVLGAGEPFDLLNSAIYLAEGDTYNARLSLMSAFLVGGWGATAFKWGSFIFVGAKVSKGVKAVKGSAKAVEGAKKVANNAPIPRKEKIIIKTPVATKMAEEIGFHKTKYLSSGEAVYANSKNTLYITIYNTSHNGGIWKMAEKPEYLESKTTRLGTYNADLTIRIGD